jgi:hypothetical protein
MTSSRSSVRRRDAREAPDCSPGLRSDRPREDRFFASFLSRGASEGGRRDEFDEPCESVATRASGYIRHSDRS